MVKYFKNKQSFVHVSSERYVTVPQVHRLTIVALHQDVVGISQCKIGRRFALTKYVSQQLYNGR